MKRYIVFFFAAFCSLILASCGNRDDVSDKDSYMQSEDGTSSFESSDTSSALSSAPSSESSEETGEHEVTLCNGIGQDVTALRIRSGSGEEDYWSYEILSGVVWQDGTAISLTLRDEEWIFTSAWEMEVTLADGTIMSYDSIPLSDASMIELIPEGYNRAE